MSSIKPITSEDLYDIFNSTGSIDKRIELLRTMDYNFYQESQPDAILSWFYDDIETQEQANQIAEIFMRRLGDTIICREASCCENKFLTIMDYIFYSKEWEGMPCPQIILNAFQQMNFKFSAQCNKTALCRMYCADPYYAKKGLGKLNNTFISGKKRSMDIEVVSGSFTKMKLAK